MIVQFAFLALKMKYLRNIEIKIKTKMKQIRGLLEIAALIFGSRSNLLVKPRWAVDIPERVSGANLYVAIMLDLGWWPHRV